MHGTKLANFRKYGCIYANIFVGFSFLLLTLITVKTLAPEVKSEAAIQTASQTIGPYTMSMSNDSVTTIDAVPTPSQQIYSSSNNLNVTNTCTAGATITMAMNSTSNSLIRPSEGPEDVAIKEIAATTTTGLDINSWGYALTDGSTYYAVPKKNATPATIYNASAAQNSALSVPLKFGVKLDYTMPSGSYSNDILFTMAPKTGCLSYLVNWNYGGGTAQSGATYPTSMNWGQTMNLSTLTPTRTYYSFTGWTNGSSNFTGSEVAANINPSNATSVTMTAKWQENKIAYKATGYGGTADGKGHTITVNVTTPGCTVKYGTTSGTYNLTTPPSYSTKGEYTIYYQITKSNYPTVTGNAKVIIKNPDIDTASTVTDKGNGSFDITNGSIKSTYGNGGYHTYIKVNGGSENQMNANTFTTGGVTISRSTSTRNEYGRVQTTYTVKNTNSSAVTVAVAVYTDIQVNSNDSAPIYVTNYGFYSSDGTYKFAYYVKNTEYINNVDTVYLGQYTDANNNKWTNRYVNVSGVDSGIAFSWANRSIPAGGSITLTWAADII